MAEPYYQDEMVTLYHGDCLEISVWLDAEVLVTDPPYGLGYVESRSSTRGNKLMNIAGDKDTSLRDSTLEMWGREKPALVFGRWDRPRPAGTHHRLVWDKVNGGMGDLTFPWSPSDEEIYATGSWPTVSPGGRRREGGIPTRHPNVIRCPTLNSQAKDRPDHPTPKPVALMEALIANTSGSIADPFAGAGATLIAARNLGRRVVGVEIEERYCEITATRLAQQAFDFNSNRE